MKYFPGVSKYGDDSYSERITSNSAAILKPARTEAQFGTESWQV